MRSVDADGHMRVEESRISKANVCPYKGSEIPDSEALGLDQNKIYWLLRDPNELAKAASTFDGKPLLIRHVPISADLPSQELWVGTLGPCKFESPYLITRPLMVLTQDAIDAIESNELRELSAGYRYDAAMEPGTFEGQRYDGRMVNIRGNHVAIVSEGRVGPDVHVADESPPELRSMKHEKLMAALKPHLKDGADLLALDGALDDSITIAVAAAVKLALDKKAKDEDMTDEEKKAACDAYREDCDMGKDAELSDEDKEKAYKAAKDRKAKDAKAKDESPDHRKDFEPNAAKDSVTKDELSAAVKLAGDTARKQMRDLMIAREDVQPIVGAVSLALDSAEDVYAFALKAKGVDVKGIHPSAYKAMLGVVAAKADSSVAPELALDATGHDLADINSIFLPH